MQTIESTRNVYPDAGHVCWAFICGELGNFSDYGYSDDGEPSGTAGKPILNVLQHNPVTNICALVVRYFGGIKLGAGGLVRAYSSATSKTLEAAELTEIISQKLFYIHAPYALEDRLRRLIAECGGEIFDPIYTEMVAFSIRLPAVKCAEFKSRCTDIGKGQIQFRAVDSLKDGGSLQTLN